MGTLQRDESLCLSALNILGDNAAAKSFDLAELIATEYGLGDCKNAAADLKDLVNMVNLPKVNADAKGQLIATLKQQLTGKSCPEMPTNLDAFFAK